MSKKLLVIICLILAAFFLYWVGSQFAEQLLGWLDVPVTTTNVFNARSSQDYKSVLYVHGPALVFALAALVAVLRNKKLMTFFVEATGELQKVTYPMPKEAGQSAVVVLILVALSVAVLSLYDVIWQNAVLLVM